MSDNFCDEDTIWGDESFWAENDTLVEEDLIPLIAQAVGVYAQPLYDKIPARTSSLSGAKYVEETLEAGHPKVVQELFWMPLRVFESLQAELLEKNLLSSSKYIGISEKLAIFLAAVGNGLSNRRLQDRFVRVLTLIR